MTEHNNSNADGERPNPTPNNGDPGSADFDAAWAQFAAEHAEDLNDVLTMLASSAPEAPAAARAISPAPAGWTPTT